MGRRCGRRVSRRRFGLPRARLPAENDDKSACLTSSWMAASGLRRRSPRLRTRDDQASAHRATGIGRPVLRFTNRTHRWAASGRRSPRPVVRGLGGHLTASVLPALTAPAERAMGSGRAALLLLLATVLPGKGGAFRPDDRAPGRQSRPSFRNPRGDRRRHRRGSRAGGACSARTMCTTRIRATSPRSGSRRGTLTRRVGHRVPAAFT